MATISRFAYDGISDCNNCTLYYVTVNHWKALLYVTLYKNNYPQSYSPSPSKGEGHTGVSYNQKSSFSASEIASYGAAFCNDALYDSTWLY